MRQPIDINTIMQELGDGQHKVNQLLQFPRIGLFM